MPPPYRKLLLVLAINAILMFLLTYTMIDSLGHFRFNINRVYMALLMVAPMAILMLFMMHSMYDDKRLNTMLYAGFAVLFVSVFALARTQGLVGNDQFLRSMIPHHSSAILMCERSSITDPEIVSLCDTIVKAQKEEIATMEALLER